MRAVPIGCFLLVCLIARAPILAADWPQFRGPGGRGISTSPDAPIKWGPTQNIAWKTPLPGPGSSSPIVGGDRVFVTCYSGYGITPDQGQATDLKRHALCLDRNSGKILWSFVAEGKSGETPYTGRYIIMHGYASATPVTDGKNVYFFLARSGVFAFTVQGKRLWQFDAGTSAHDWGSGASPILAGDLLIVNASSESDQLIALDKNTGKQVWAARGMARAWNTPALVEPVKGKPELLAANQTHLRAFDPRSGAELWRCAAIRAAEICPSIVCDGQFAYQIGSPKGEAMAIRCGGGGDVTASAVKWRVNKGSNVSSPLLAGGHLYFANDKNGTLLCLNAATGDLVYEQRPEPRAGMIYSSPVLVNDKLYFFSRTAGCYIVAAAPAFGLLAHNPPLDSSNCSASPAIVDGRIYIRSDSAVYCIR